MLEENRMLDRVIDRWKYENARKFSLSPRERAGVRGKGA
jgi:hypothetical protein